MKWANYTSRQENYIYLILWVLMFAAPISGMVILSTIDDSYTIRWMDVFVFCRPMLYVLLIFLIHNYLFAPLLIYHNKTLKYLTSIIVLIAAFVMIQCTSGPPARPMMPQHVGAAPHEGFEDDPFAPPAEEFPRCDDKRLPPQSRGAKPEQPKRFPLSSPHDYTMFVLLVFALGANLGIKLYFKTQADNNRSNDLEKERLSQELTYLRYQVNPHFFMNTLNNIHALVDIDPDLAKTSIVKMSRFMRYLLYDCDVDSITLQRGVSLIKGYIELMRLRYNDKVNIQFDAPAEDVSHVDVAPLIFIPFIENAFKHGVSYNKPSFIHVSLSVKQNKIHFECRNSKNGVSQDKGGVGLTNVTKRLALIYGDKYRLHIEDGAATYIVQLTLPDKISDH